MSSVRPEANGQAVDYRVVGSFGLVGGAIAGELAAGFLDAGHNFLLDGTLGAFGAGIGAMLLTRALLYVGNLRNPKTQFRSPGPRMG